MNEKHPSAFVYCEDSEALYLDKHNTFTDDIHGCFTRLGLTLANETTSKQASDQPERQPVSRRAWTGNMSTGRKRAAKGKECSATIDQRDIRGTEGISPLICEKHFYLWLDKTQREREKKRFQRGRPL